MELRKIKPDIKDIPEEFHSLIKNAEIFDSSCSPEARVIFIDKGYFLKSAPKGALKTEVEMTRFFHKKGLSAEVIDYISDEKDWLLTEKIKGEDCTYYTYLESPERLCDTIAEKLRYLHDLDYSECPVFNRNESYFSLAEENYHKGIFDKSFLSEEISPKEAFEIVLSGKKLFENNTLLHGDYCLPNIILDNWKFSGFIDLGNGGVGDRHIDLFWGAWTLFYNLKTDKYRKRFFEAYGLDRIDFEKLRVVEAAETFG